MRVKLSQIKQIVGLFFILCSSVAYAGYDAAGLKKLFTDQGQRARIDAERSGNYSGEQEQQTRKVKVSGYMTRSDGESVVWVNGKNTLEASKFGNVKVHQSSVGKSKKITLTVKEKTIRLKAGETWISEPDYSDGDR
jgi:hypothetical protein